MSYNQDRELEPFQWGNYMPSAEVDEVSAYDWDIEEERIPPPLTLQDLQTEGSDLDSLPELVGGSSVGSNSNSITTLTNIMLYTSDKEIEDKDGECECPICYEPICKEQKIKTNCNHIYCDTCMITYLDTCYINHKDPCCAMCREVYTCFEILNPPTFEKVKAKLDEYESDEESDNASIGSGEEMEREFRYLQARRNWNFRGDSEWVSFDVDTLFDT